MSESIISVGASKEAIAEAREAIFDILKADRSDTVTTVALETLATLCETNNTTISNNTFTR